MRLAPLAELEDAREHLATVTALVAGVNETMPALQVGDHLGQRLREVGEPADQPLEGLSKNAPLPRLCLGVVDVAEHDRPLGEWAVEALLTHAKPQPQVDDGVSTFGLIGCDSEAEPFQRAEGDGEMDRSPSGWLEWGAAEGDGCEGADVDSVCGDAVLAGVVGDLELVLERRHLEARWHDHLVGAGAAGQVVEVDLPGVGVGLFDALWQSLLSLKLAA